MAEDQHHNANGRRDGAGQVLLRAPSAFIHKLESIRGNHVLRYGLLIAHSCQEATESGLPFSRFITCPLTLCSATATLCLWL